jgi:hypothetical protein
VEFITPLSRGNRWSPEGKKANVEEAKRPKNIFSAAARKSSLADLSRRLSSKADKEGPGYHW